MTRENTLSTENQRERERETERQRDREKGYGYCKCECVHYFYTFGLLLPVIILNRDYAFFMYLSWSLPIKKARMATGEPCCYEFCTL